MHGHEFLMLFQGGLGPCHNIMASRTIRKSVLCHKNPCHAVSNLFRVMSWQDFVDFLDSQISEWLPIKCWPSDWSLGFLVPLLDWGLLKAVSCSGKNAMVPRISGNPL